VLFIVKTIIMNQKQVNLKIKQELIKCKKDPAYFMRNYCFIQHPQRGKIKFDLYPFQEDALHDLHDHRFNIILKSRQLGISTLSAGDALWNCLFTPDFNGLIVATKLLVAKNLLKKITVMYNMLPDWFKTKNLKMNRIVDNVLSQGFANGSTILAEGCTDQAGRSGSFSKIYIDEAGFINERLITDLWNAIFPTLSTGGRAVILSTPNGIGNWFHRMWTDAEEQDNAKNNGFNPIKLHWTVHPDRDQDWRDEQTRILGVTNAGQECDCDWLAAGSNFISLRLLQKEYEPNLVDPIDRLGPENGYWKFKYPDFSRQYIISADVARGDGTDYSTFHVLDVHTLEQCAEFKAQVGTTQFAVILNEIGKDWNNALLVVENNNNGWAVVTKLEELEYPNLYYSPKDIRAYDSEVYMKKNHHLKDERTEMIPGFTTTKKTRPLLLSNLQNHFNEGTLKNLIKSKRLYNEFTVFIWKSGKPQSMSGYNDDLVIAYGIGLWIRDTVMKLETAGVNSSKQMLNGINSGLNMLPQSTLNTYNKQTYMWTDTRGNVEDLRKYQR